MPEGCHRACGMKEQTNWRRVGLLLLLIALCVVITALLRREDAGFLRKHGDIGTLDFHPVLVCAQGPGERPDPYDRTLLYGVQVAEGLRDPAPVMMWNPPWLVTLVLPVLSFSFLTSSAIWFGVNVVFIVLTGVLVQATYAGRLRRDPLILVAMFLFMPHISTLYCGQLGLLSAVSVSTFLFGARRNAPALMGLGLVPLSVKPHLFYLAAIYLAYWILIGRRWKVILWFALGFGVLVVATSLLFPMRSGNG